MTATIEEMDGSRRYVWPRTLEDEANYFSAHCHGAGGIGQFLIRLWYYCRDKRFLEAAYGAAAAVEARDPKHSSQCHGRAGDGALFLDLFQATGDEHFKAMAHLTGRRLGIFRKLDEEGIWTRSSHGDVSPDYMSGYAGVGAFCWRLSSPETAPDLIIPSIDRFRPV